MILFLFDVNFFSNISLEGKKWNMKVSLIINWWNDPSESYQIFIFAIISFQKYFVPPYCSREFSSGTNPNNYFRFSFSLLFHFELSFRDFEFDIWDLFTLLVNRLTWRVDASHWCKICKHANQNCLRKSPSFSFETIHNIQGNFPMEIFHIVVGTIELNWWKNKKKDCASRVAYYTQILIQSRTTFLIKLPNCGPRWGPYPIVFCSK